MIDAAQKILHPEGFREGQHLLGTDCIGDRALGVGIIAQRELLLPARALGQYRLAVGVVGVGGNTIAVRIGNAGEMMGKSTVLVVIATHRPVGVGHTGEIVVGVVGVGVGLARGIAHRCQVTGGIVGEGEAAPKGPGDGLQAARDIVAIARRLARSVGLGQPPPVGIIALGGAIGEGQRVARRILI